MFCQLYLISKKGLNAKMRKKCKKLSNTENVFVARFLFYKIHISGAVTATPEFNIQNVFFFFLFFFLSSHHDTNPLLHLYHFHKKYNYILANTCKGIKSESSRVIFSFFFCLHPVGQTLLYPSKFCNHLKHSAK